MDERLERAARSRAMRDKLLASDPQTQKRMQLDMLRGQGDSMIDMPPPAVIAEDPNYTDPGLERWQPGMTSPWDPEGFSKEPFVDNVSDVDRAAYLHNAGFRGDNLITMVAISMAENREGDPWAMGRYSPHDNTGENEGKWQLALGLQQLRPLTNPQDHAGDEWRDFAQLLDPQYNADAAMLEFKQKKGFGGWAVTHDKYKGTSNDYRMYLDRARQAVAELNRILGRAE